MSHFVWNKIDHLVVYPNLIAKHTVFCPFLTSAALRERVKYFMQLVLE